MGQDFIDAIESFRFKYTCNL